jgi:glycosyltransferase involved in cell wall biosynthesis
MSSDCSIAVVHNKIRDYRIPLFELLDANFDVKFLIFDQNQGEFSIDVDFTDKKNIIKNISKPDYDIVILPDFVFKETWLAGITAIVSGKPVITWSEVWDMPHTPIHKQLIKRSLAMGVSLFSNSFIVPGKKSSIYLRENTLAKSDDVFLAPNAPNLIESQKEIEQQYEIDKNDLVILYLGQIVNRKRVSDIIKGYNQLEIADDTKLLIGGTGDKDYTEYLKQIAEPSTTEFLGWVPDDHVRPLYEIADVYVLPSLQDPYPLTVVEAMSVGTSVIVSEGVGEAGDIVRHGETGEIVPTKSPNHIEDSLERILTDQGYRESLSKRSKKVIRDTITYEKMLVSFREAINHANS